MSHLLANVNPEAAAQADSGWQPGPEPLLQDALVEPVPQPRSDLPLPGVGNWVVYHLRSGDSRNRRTFFPALVMATNEEAGTLMLWVVVDDGDTWMREHVRARAEPEEGWELVRPASGHYGKAEPLPAPWGAGLQHEGVPIKVVDTILPEPNDSLRNMMEIVDACRAEIAALFGRVTTLEAKRGPGRPPKLKD